MKHFSFLKKLRVPGVLIPRVSQKRLVWGFIGIGVFVLLLFLGILPLVDAAKKMEDEISMKRKIIQKYDDFMQSRKTVEEDLQRTQKQYEEIQQRLLSGETPQLGAATLQEIVKKLADKNGIAIRSFKILDPKETTPYRKVSIQIEYSPVNNMLSLGQFFHDLEHQDKKLYITEMDLLVFNVRAPANIQGNLVITGLMKGAKVKEKGEGGVGFVAEVRRSVSSDTLYDRSAGVRKLRDVDGASGFRYGKGLVQEIERQAGWTAASRGRERCEVAPFHRVLYLCGREKPLSSGSEGISRHCSTVNAAGRTTACAARR